MGGIFSMATMYKVALNEKLPTHGLPSGSMEGFVNTGRDTDGGYKQEAWSYWQVYAEDMTKGNPLRIGETVYLRHLVTGQSVSSRSSCVMAVYLAIGFLSS
jgi:hypothetical protein